MSIAEPADLADLTYNEPFVTVAILLIVVLGFVGVAWDALLRADQALALDPTRHSPGAGDAAANLTGAFARRTRY